jgi:membrane dipeptidase
VCDCFALTRPTQVEGRPRRDLGSAPSDARPTTTGSSRSPRPDALARSAASREAGPWVDTHAHPGRFFVRGLSAEDPAAALLGRDTVDDALRDLRTGGADLCCFATVADLRVLGVEPTGGIRARRAFEPGEAHRDHERQLAALDEICARPGVARILAPGDWRTAQGADAIGILTACEGGDFLEGRLERVEQAHRRGVRSIGLVHYRVNELGDIQTEPPVHGGLSAFGASVVREMNRLGLIIDLAHGTYELTRQVLDLSTRPVLLSHSHLARGTDSHPRLLRREHARAVAEAGGLLGAWPAGVELEGFDDFVDEILRMIDLLGVAHVALGTDMDANYRPVLESYRELPALAEALADRGLAETEIASVLGGNFIRLFEAVAA